MGKLIRRVDADTISKYLGKECFNDLGQKCVVVGYCKAYRLFILAVLDKDAAVKSKLTKAIQHFNKYRYMRT